MPKRSGFKYQLEQALLENYWEIVQTDTIGQWWEDEHWKLEHQHNPELNLYICFMVDPMFEGHRKEGQGIWEIKATTQLPKTRLDDEHTISSIHMSKRNFEIKLNEFIFNLNAFKAQN